MYLLSVWGTLLSPICVKNNGKKGLFFNNFTILQQVQSQIMVSVHIFNSENSLLPITNKEIHLNQILMSLS